MKLFTLSPTERAAQIIKILKETTKNMVPPAANTIVEQYGRDPYLVLVSCILSLRTRDTVSLSASLRLFQQAKTPQEMIALPLKAVEEIIYPVGFYKNKARQIIEISHVLLEDFAGTVPGTFDQLMSLRGVGPKTANLVLAQGFGKPAICVDTHVHRISNRLGLIKTKTPVETEAALKKLLPEKYWSEYNQLLVMWGQNICVPISPFCSKCPVFDLCARAGVTKSR